MTGEERFGSSLRCPLTYVGARLAMPCNSATLSLHCSASAPLSLANTLTSYLGLCRSHPLLTDSDALAFRDLIATHTRTPYQGAPSHPEWLALIQRRQRQHDRSSRLSCSCVASAGQCRCESVADWLKNVQHTFRFPTGSFTLTARS